MLIWQRWWYHQMDHHSQQDCQECKSNTWTGHASGWSRQRSGPLEPCGSQCDLSFGWGCFHSLRFVRNNTGHSCQPRSLSIGPGSLGWELWLLNCFWIVDSLRWLGLLGTHQHLVAKPKSEIEKNQIMTYSLLTQRLLLSVPWPIRLRATGQ